MTRPVEAVTVAPELLLPAQGDQPALALYVAADGTGWTSAAAERLVARVRPALTVGERARFERRVRELLGGALAAAELEQELDDLEKGPTGPAVERALASLRATLGRARLIARWELLLVEAPPVWRDLGALGLADDVLGVLHGAVERAVEEHAAGKPTPSAG